MVTLAKNAATQHLYGVMKSAAVAACRGVGWSDSPSALLTVLTTGGQTAILVRWSAAQQTTEMLADQRTGKNSGPAPADYQIELPLVRC